MYVELLHEEAENDVILQNRSAEVAFANQSDLPPIVVHSIRHRRDIPATYGVCQLLGRSLYILDYLTQIPHSMSMSDMRLLVIPVTTNSSIFILVLLMCLLPDWPNAPYIGIFASWTFDQNVAGDRDQRGKFWSYTKSKDDLYSMCYAYSKRIVAYYRC